ncbi:hypothetical protein DMH18_14465 [Streptomyces sp. WAC 06783]|nr:hypothetical protein DMH18_14465 [Streptomyces sp. WAC 06783]
MRCILPKRWADTGGKSAALIPQVEDPADPLAFQTFGGENLPRLTPYLPDVVPYLAVQGGQSGGVAAGAFRGVQYEDVFPREDAVQLVSFVDRPLVGAEPLGNPLQRQQITAQPVDRLVDLHSDVDAVVADEALLDGDAATVASARLLFCAAVLRCLRRLASVAVRGRLLGPRRLGPVGASAGTDRWEGRWCGREVTGLLLGSGLLGRSVSGRGGILVGHTCTSRMMGKAGIRCMWRS